MNIEGQESVLEWRRLPSPAAALRTAFAAVTGWDEAPSPATDQRQEASAAALFCLPTLDWPPNLFA